SHDTNGRLHNQPIQKGVYSHEPLLQEPQNSIPATIWDSLHAAEDKENLIYQDYF
ncbi:unnamed protein product, partial [marine sediment metagenome]